MKKFLKNAFLFGIVILIIGEIIVRLTHAVSDIPQRTIGEDKIQKYFPNQKGYWKGGDHTWMINEMGWPGQLPDSYENLVMVIGDSYIENFMNPNECHQSVFLKKNLQDYNFMETARSGVSLIEAMEISKHIDSLKPIHTLIYVNNEDFFESIIQVKPMNDITQLDIETNNIQYGEMKAPFIKKVLYTWKLSYYFYNRFYFGGQENIAEQPQNPAEKTKEESLKYKLEISKLMTYIKENYSIDNKTLVFHPSAEQLLIDICKSNGFNVILLDASNDKSWSFEYDNHWTCYGHERAAKQVSASLMNGIFKNTIR